MGGFIWWVLYIWNGKSESGVWGFGCKVGTLGGVSKFLSLYLYEVMSTHWGILCFFFFILSKHVKPQLGSLLEKMKKVTF